MLLRGNVMHPIPSPHIPQSMNTNWSKILLFSLLSFALGVVICCLCCRMCGGGSCHTGGCGKEMSCERGGGGACMHGGEGKEACCKGGHGAGHGAGHGEGQGEGHHDDGVHAIVHELEASNFQGDTTIAIDGGTVNVRRDGDKTEVKVEVRDSTRKSVTVDMHGH